MPELHLLLGVVQLLFDSLKKDYPEVADTWLKESGVFLDFHNQFNGNNARKLLKSVVNLSSISPGRILASCYFSFIKIFIFNR